MGRRSEQRIAVSLPVIIRGTDAHGSPFSTAVQTADISVSGVRLRGLLDGSVQTGTKIEIECNGAKGVYRVQWVGDHDSPAAGQLGARSLEPGKYIWSIPPSPWAPDSFDPLRPDFFRPPPAVPGPGSPAWSGVERRRFPRANCRVEASVSTDDDETSLRGTVTDVSLDGCYFEMLSPLPVDTLIHVTLVLESGDVRATGRVRSSHVGLGMGVEFLAMAPPDFEKLQQLTPPSAAAARPANAAAASHSSVADGLNGDAEIAVAAPAQSASHLPTTAEALEAIVRVLSRKGLLTRIELSQELERLKTAKSDALMIRLIRSSSTSATVIPHQHGRRGTI